MSAIIAKNKIEFKETKRNNKEMVNYTLSIIYKLCCKDPSVTDEYIGSTLNFTRRKNAHKSRCNNEKDSGYNVYVYKFIREHGGWYNWDMVEVERYSAQDRADLHTRERFWVEELESTLNKQIPTRSNDEWITDNKEKMSEYKAGWYQDNKEKLSEKQAERYQNNKEKISEKQAERYQNNKKNIREKQVEYRQNNKKKIAQDRAEKATCECGAIVRKYTLPRHRLSKIHIKFITEN